VHSIVQSSKAEQDLTEIWIYTAEEWSLAQADLYIDELVAGIEKLGTHPELGYSRDDIRSGYRSLNVSQHIVFYKIMDEEIQIMRVLHKSVDIERTFTQTDTA